MFKIILLLFCFLSLPLPLHAAEQDKTKYEEALQLARDGRHEAALPILKQLTEQFPETRHYLYDYITVLGWAERDTEVLSFQPRIDFERAPVYLIETFGRSARNRQDYPLAIQFYMMASHREPDRLESALGLALSRAENGEIEKAIKLIQSLDEKYPKRIDILDSLAYVYELEDKPIEALAVYQRMLEIDPDHRESLRKQILIATRLGAPHLAASMAQKAPGLLTTEELEGITGDQAAQSIGWGNLYNPSPQDRFQDTDAAIRLLQDQLQHLDGRGEAASPAYRRARFDLIAALRDRRRFEEVIAIYKELKDESAEIPDYVMPAVADAYMHKRKPEVAREIYLNLLEQNPDDYDTKIALFYALFESGAYKAALQLIDTLAAEQEDPQRKLQAESTAIMGYAWSGQLEEALDRLEPLVERAPHNPSLQSKLGYLQLWRGWPRGAKETFLLSKTIEPEVLDAQLGEIGAARDLNEFHDADAKITRLTQDLPDYSQVQRLHRDWEIHNMRELLIEFSHGKSSGVQEGSKDITYDVRFYSSPFKYHTRFFGHGHYSLSEFPEGTGIYRRYGAGLEYLARDVVFVGELSTGYKRDAGLGIKLRGNWMPNDFWVFGAQLDTYSNDIPLRGRLNEDVDGWSIGLNSDYRFHESRAIGVGLQWLEFSDTNRRFVYFGSITQRFITLPSYKLDGRLGLYGSSNTLDNASYYNPGRDLSIEAGLTNEWLVFRYHSRSFIHRIGLSLGNYHQSGFASNGFWGIDYEHEWGINERLFLFYGIGRSRPVYDGVSETLIRFFLTLNWRY